MARSKPSIDIIDIMVKIKAHQKTLRGKFHFSYSSKDARVASNGDIKLSADRNEVTLQFHLETKFIVVGGVAGVQHLPVSFDPGSGNSGRVALKIWREGDATREFPSAFNAPALSTSADGRANAVVTTTDTNLLPEVFKYSLGVVVERPGGRQFRKVDDPRIRNGGVS